MHYIPKIGMRGVSREIIPFWYEIHTFVLTVHRFVRHCDLHLHADTSVSRLLNLLAASLKLSMSSDSQPLTSTTLTALLSSSSVRYCVVSTPNCVQILWKPLLAFTTTPGTRSKSHGPLSLDGTLTVTASPRLNL